MAKITIIPDRPLGVRAFVVRTQPNRERVARDFLERFGFSTYLPLMRVKVRHARKQQEVDRPFLPMYLFLWDDENCDLGRVRNSPGVSGFVRQGMTTARATYAMVDSIRRREQVVQLDGSGNEIRRIVLDDAVVDGFKPGQTLKIEDDVYNPFNGFDVLFNYRIDEERVSVFLSIFGQLTQTTIDPRILKAV